jgi:hypothetical protein
MHHVRCFSFLPAIQSRLDVLPLIRDRRSQNFSNPSRDSRRSSAAAVVGRPVGSAAFLTTHSHMSHCSRRVSCPKGVADLERETTLNLVESPVCNKCDYKAADGTESCAD